MNFVQGKVGAVPQSTSLVSLGQGIRQTFTLPHCSGSVTILVYHLVLQIQESLAVVFAEAWIFKDSFCDLTLTCNAHISGMLTGFCVQLFSQTLYVSSYERFCIAFMLKSAFHNKAAVRLWKCQQKSIKWLFGMCMVFAMSS